MLTRRHRGDPPPGWDAWLRRQGFQAGFCQTGIRARMHRALNGVEPYWITVGAEPDYAAGLLLFHHPGPPWSSSPRVRLKAWVLGALLECAEGPVLASGSDHPALLPALLAEVDALARDLSAGRVIFGAPPPAADWLEDAALLSIFRAFGFAARPWATALVDLHRDEEALLAGFRQAARKCIRKCQRAGVGVEICTTFETFRDRFWIPYQRANPGQPDKDPARLQAWFEADAGCYRFLSAVDEQGEVLATLGSYAFNGVATEVISARTVRAQQTNLPAQDLLHWELFRLHRAAGDRWFNLAGYNPEPADPKEEGIRRFKMKWNGWERPAPAFSFDRRGWVRRRVEKLARNGFRATPIKQ